MTGQKGWQGATCSDLVNLINKVITHREFQYFGGLKIGDTMYLIILNFDNTFQPLRFCE